MAPTFIKSCAELVLAYLFPSECLFCAEEGTFLCLKCSKTLPLEFRGRQLGTGKNRFFAYSVLPYGDPRVRSLIKAWKYDGLGALSAALASFCFVALPPQLFSISHMVVPVPADRSHRHYFDQAAAIAKLIAEKYDLTFLPAALQKIRSTAPQSSMSPATRKTNVSKTIALGRNSAQIKGQTILLVDDVLTTGATLIECARVLRRAGAKKVLALTIAYGGGREKK